MLVGLIKQAGQLNSAGSWHRELTGYHWWVLAVAAMAWSFDTMDQRIFILARGPAMISLLPAGATPAEVTYYSGVATAIFMLGWAIGGFCFGVLGDRWGRAKTMMLTVLLYSAFTGLSALSQHIWDFSLYRFLTGLGVGGEFAAGVTLVAEVMPSSARAHALGVLQAFGAVGNIINVLTLAEVHIYPECPGFRCYIFWMFPGPGFHTCNKSAVQKCCLSGAAPSNNQLVGVR